MTVAGRLEALSPEQRALFEKLREKQRQSARTHVPPPVLRVSGPTGEGDWPLSLDQERFWFMEQLYPGGAGLTITAATRMRGPISVPVVSRALDEIARRHAAWRTTFPVVDGRLVQRVSAGLAPRRQRLGLVDLSTLPEARRELEALRLVEAVAAAPLDLEAGPLVRAALVRLGREDHLCLLAIHHLVTDWISFQIVWGELAALCEAFAARRTPALPEPPVEYSDFALWQREWLQGEVLDGLVSWWRETLRDVPLALKLPTDRPRPGVMRMRGGRRLLAASRALSEALRKLARQQGVTLFMAVLAATAALLHRLSGQERLILGANNANRNRPELEPVLGCFLTQVPFAIDLAGDPTFRELLARVRQSALGAFAHQDLPFGKLVEAIQPERDTSRQPIVQALVQVLDGQYSKASLGGVTFEAVDAWDGASRYDLMLTLFDDPDGLAGSLEYDADLFDPATAERWSELLFLQAARVVADPELRLSALPVLTAAARHQLLAEGCDTARPLPEWTVPERFEQQAARSPRAVAVIAGGQALTYAELSRRSDVLAHHLRAAGAGSESRVALLLDRTLDVPVAILAVWKAGSAIVPLDPDSPAERIASLLTDAEPVALVHRGPLPFAVPDRLGAIDLASEPKAGQGALQKILPSQLAYLIYTSGTTGKPKAVMVEHGSLAAILAAVLDRFGFGPDDHLPHLARFTFDISLAELFLPLLAGGTSEILALDEILEPGDLLDALERSTRAFIVPSLLRRITPLARERGPERFAVMRTVIAGGEAVPPELRADFLTAFPAVDLAVCYGPTETAILASFHGVERSRRPERSLIGRPFDNVEVRVVDARGALVAPGVPGELWIGGAGVGRGYFRRPDLTADRFVEADGRRFYRSGDLVRQVASEGGDLEFVGRTDHQIKLRGFRIEPGEIEAALLEHPGVRDAVVVAAGDGDRQRLVAYLAPADLETDRLRAHLAKLLPAYMVPSTFVLLPELPLTANAKVDRSRLPSSAGEQEGVGDAPRSPVEEVVAGIWCEVLGLPRVSRAANFFDLGGHSLLATQVVTRLRASTGAELTVRDLFQAPTVAALAAMVEAAISSGVAALAPPIRTVPRDRDLPLSFAQERLWFLDRLAPGNVGYHIPLVLAAQGALSLPALQAALDGIVRRHEALRTTFAARGDRPVQVIAPPAASSVPLVDLAALPRQQEEARRLAEAAVAKPFDLERDPVLRASAVRLSPEEHVLLLAVHHIAADGWSVGVIVEEIAGLYSAALARIPSPLPELPFQYADFAVWQREWLQGEALERQLAYWRGRLAGVPVLELPTDRPRPAVQSFRGATRMREIGPQTARALEFLARRHDATLFMVLLAAIQTLLGRYAGQEDVVVGSPIANRTRPEIEPLIGFFVNSLALRGDLTGDPSFSELIARSRRAALEAYSHQDLPFERLVEELNPERKLSHNPLFQVMFAVQNAPLGAVELLGLTFSPVEIDFLATRFDLEVFFTPLDGGLSVQLTWSTDLFDPATVLRLAGHLDALLAAALEDPSRRLSEMPVLPDAERHQLLLDWNDTAAAIPPDDVAALFAEQARRRAGAIAVSSDEGDLSYAELDLRSSRLARRLAAAGVGPEVRVALLAQRSPAMLVGLLGILKAGGAYVPLDPAYPAERLAWMLADSEARVLLGQPELLADLPEGVRAPVTVELAAEPEEVEGPEPTHPLPGGLAYVMYTSGSTGRPKGVGVTHRNIVRLVRESGFADLGADQVFLQLAPISFDASTLEIWAPLLNGGRVAIFPPRRPSLEELGEAIARWRVTSLWLTAGLFHQMVEDRLESLRPLRQLLAGGDVLSPPHVRRALAELPDVTLINGYGPTEGTTFTCCYRMSDPGAVGSTVPLGRPIGNTRVHVLGPDLRPVPTGVWGELCAAGDGLSRGYLGGLGRPDLTAERFVPDPFGGPGGRLYRTGDVARFRPDGLIEFQGRCDGQVKLRGFRVELGEIESALARHPAVRAAAVAARDDGGPAGKRLVAYVVPRPEEVSADAKGLQHVEQWRELYDQTYAQGPPEAVAADATFNIQGWNSSYTGEAIPAEEMREWLEGTVDRLLALPHQRVMEVGCGTGLLLFRVAPEAERYRGSDFSAVALAQVQSELGRQGLPHVELAQGLADDWTGVEPGDFDLVVLNSVVQYFPSVEYLVRVLEGAVAAVSPGGAVFVGDVRSLPLLEAFHTSVQLHRASDSLPVAELTRRIRRRVAEEEELVVDPALFHALARRLPQVSGVEVLRKRGKHANELTKFRYDVVLHVGPHPPAPSPAPPEHTLPGRGGVLLSVRVDSPTVCEVDIAADAVALELLAGAGREMETVAELRSEIDRRVRESGAMNLQDLWKRADHLGWDAELPWSAYANDPLRADQSRRLVPELKRRLESELPEYMVPSAFVLLDALPLTPNGKVDRAALPAPERLGDTAATFVAPATPLEERLARVAAEVLGVEQVGMRDNFFDLGGHSLLATQLVSRLTREHSIQVTLQMVFDSATLADLADAIVEQELRSADGELLDEALREMEGLSDAELRAMLEEGVR